MKVQVKKDEKAYKGHYGNSLIINNVKVSYCNLNNPEKIKTKKGEFEKRIVSVSIPNISDKKIIKGVFETLCVGKDMKKIKMPAYKNKKDELIITGETLGNVRCDDDLAALEDGAIVDVIFKIYADSKRFKDSKGQTFESSIKLRPTFVKLIKQGPSKSVVGADVDIWGIPEEDVEHFENQDQQSNIKEKEEKDDDDDDDDDAFDPGW